MTNTCQTAFLILWTLTTNWVGIGTFTAKDGKKFDVEEGQFQTNTVLQVEFEGRTTNFVLKSLAGPKVGERKIELPSPVLYFFTNNWILTNPPTLYLTNAYDFSY